MERVIDQVGLFLIETKVADVVVKKVMRKVDFKFFVVVSLSGRKGGLVFCWRLELQFDFVRKSSNIFHPLIKPENEYQDFFCSLVYRQTLWHQKEAFWDQLRVLGSQSQFPWVYLGDFE